MASCSKISRLASWSISPVKGVENLLTLGQHAERLAVTAQQGMSRPGQVLSDHREQPGDLAFDRIQLTLEFLSLLDHSQSLPAPPQPRRSQIAAGTDRFEGARILAGLRSADGPLSVRARPSSLKRDCARRTTGAGGKILVDV